MTLGKMHPDQIDTDVALVRRLVVAQFPQCAALPIEPVRAGGTVYALYRLGAGMVVRLHLRAKYLAELEKEREWLPRPQLPPGTARRHGFTATSSR